ncbi:GSCOCG00012599001-RA-CDS [Cotesia congregata]|nr:GSCOCG00012599001-RA-CDS [Cotesia congregata]
MDNNGIDGVSYKQWVSTPKVTLETTIKSTLDFVDDFCEKLVALLPHNFIAKEQAAYLRALKESITENKFIVIVDFAENYAFVVQDAAPGFNWNNDQATVYTVVIYYKVENQLTHQSMVIISDCLNHDSIAVHIYSEIIINFIKSLSSTVAKIFFLSDGAPQQYKNYKHFSNLSHYRREFGELTEKGLVTGSAGQLKERPRGQVYSYHLISKY